MIDSNVIVSERPFGEKTLTTFDQQWTSVIQYQFPVRQRNTLDGHLGHNQSGSNFGLKDPEQTSAIEKR
jgi:hypothetical protein